VQAHVRGLVGRARGEAELAVRRGSRDGDGKGTVGGGAGDDEVAARARVGDEDDFCVEAAGRSARQRVGARV
jgi:hypothetical protein